MNPSGTARTLREDVSLVLCGEAGQGLQTIEQILIHTLKQAGYNVFATQEIMSRIRGGCNATEIRVSAAPVRAFTERIDVLVPLSPDALAHLGGRVTDRTVVLAPRDAFPDAPNLLPVD
ncbi:MAG: 2-oxoacid:acceptor oxidoreductase family protein, partial [Lentisphaerae bacterium]|nr:2-oxoacid:acceptor oxidoreductase family protein [Lentisphaerota bacterium]